MGTDIKTAKIVNFTHIQCQSPVNASEGLVNLSVHIVELIDMHENKGVKFVLFESPVIDAIEPRVLFASDSSVPVVVTGDNFWDSLNLACRFGSILSFISISYTLV